MPIEFNLTSPEPLSITSFGLNLLIGTVIGLVLSWHYRRFGRSMSGRAAFSQVFPILILTTILLITIIKSSLALSLGLVGALSIVRFRTPIKEPEELAYLFMAIGVGVGLGADYRIITSIGSAAILLVLGTRSWFNRKTRSQNLFLNLEVPGGSHNGTLEKVREVLQHQVQKADVRRLDVSNGTLNATFSIDCRNDRQLVTAMNKLKSDFPEASITFIDNNSPPIS
jgi:hypothetical protein